MSITFKMRLDFDPEKLKSLSRAAWKRSLDRAAKSAKDELATDIAKSIGLGKRKVADALSVHGTDFTRLIYAKKDRLPLILFGARGPEPSYGEGTGVTYKLPRGRGKAPHAFITQIGGRRGVFQRKPAAGRIPTGELKGPSIMKASTPFLRAAASRANVTLIDRLIHEMKRALSGAGPKK